MNSMIESLPTEPAQFRLDIVRDCADLYGKFPENVGLKFVYWSHGKYDPTSADFVDQDDLELLTPHLQTADWVAIEVVGNANDRESVNRIEKEFSIVNEWAAGRRSGASVREIFGSEAISNQAGSSLVIGSNIVVSTGRSPYFFPVDCYKTVIPQALPSADGDPITYSLELAERMHQREAIVLRQLHDKAVELAVDGKPHQIAVLFGNHHTLLSVATRTLGAPTERVFISKHPQGPVDYLKHTVRFETDPLAISTEAAITEKSFVKAIALREILDKLNLMPTEKPKLLEVQNEIASLIYRGLKKTLTPKQLKTLNEQVLTLARWSRVGGDRLHPFRKKKIQQVGRDLLQLASETAI